MIKEMECRSNQKSNEHYLKFKPRPFKNIDPADPIYLREEIIIEKYVRKMFVSDRKWAPYKVGTVLKRGKYNGKWNERFFRLSNCSLVYYSSQNVSLWLNLLSNVAEYRKGAWQDPSRQGVDCRQ